MKKLIQYLETHMKMIKFFCISILMFVSFFTLRGEFEKINRHSLQQIVDQVSMGKIGLTLLLGCFSFSFATLYDQVLVHHYKFPLKKLEVLKIAWICQSFHFFVGIAGLTGPTLRYYFYKARGIDKEECEKITVPIIFLGSMGLHFLALPGYFGLVQLKNPLWILPMAFLFCLGLFVLFADYIPIPYLHHKRSPVYYIEKKTRYLLMCLSLLEWTMAAFFFYFVLNVFGMQISFLTALAVYIMSIMTGVISMIPGGIGSFEAAALLILGNLGMESGTVFFSLLLFRFGYYVFPWLIGVFLYALGKLANIWEKLALLRSSDRVCGIMGILVFFSGGILLLSTTTPNILSRVKLVEMLVPRFVPVYSTWLSFCIGLSLLVLSKGIFLGVKRAQITSIVLLFLVSFLCLMKGLDYEEASFMLAVALGLVCSRDAFQHPSKQINSMALLLYFATTILGVISYFVLYNWKHHVSFLQDNRRYSFHYLQTHQYWLFSIAVVFLIVIFLYLFTNKKYREFEENTEEVKDNFEEIREKRENSAYTHLFYMEDKNVFFNKKKTVMFLYRPYKNNIFVLGDPVGEEKEIEDAIDELILWANEQDMLVSFYEITGKYLESFVNNGLQLLKLGESATISLEESFLEGKKARGFRNILNQFEKEDYIFEQMLPPFSEETLEELENISKLWLRGRKEIGFSVGAFKANYLQKASIFVVRNKEKNIVAFASELPIPNSKILGIDLMRHLPNVKSGIMEYLFLSAMRWAKEKQYASFDIGIAPLSNVGNKLYSSRKEKVIRLAYEYGNKLYSFQGLRSFKQKFHPHWSNVYLSYKDDIVLPSVLLDITLMIHRSSYKLNEGEKK